ncbi:hypothetical protein L1049_020210 [Liquidambar formosana]|uniref:Uncharacterized protein n=1 Tax=Liquidambar formosana TaxID=63359 RepID=A0AAP0SCT2_LIQFO
MFTHGTRFFPSECLLKSLIDLGSRMFLSPKLHSNDDNIIVNIITTLSWHQHSKFRNPDLNCPNSMKRGRHCHHHDNGKDIIICIIFATEID